MVRTRSRRRNAKDRAGAGDKGRSRRASGAPGSRVQAGSAAGMHGARPNGADASSSILVRSYAKINLSIDVGRRQPDGFHPVDMIMQQVAFHDDVQVRFCPDPARPAGEIDVTLHSNLPFLPTDERNLAVRAARLMTKRYGARQPGGMIRIDLRKRIPVAAGLAGGSGNGAAVIHALNTLWHLGLSLPRIMELCGALGSDVPFCAMGQADANRVLPAKVRFDACASCTARATGTGTELEPFQGVAKPVVIAKPRISVSTAEVYQGFDQCEVLRRPDNGRLRQRILRSDPAAYEDFINVLELYTLKRYPEVERLKQEMQETKGVRTVLMSGSGPTVFAVYDTEEAAADAAAALRQKGRGVWKTKTMQ